MTETKITGKTKVCGLIGDPVDHSFSPQIHNTIYPLIGENAAYVTFHVKNDGLEAAVKGAKQLGIKGLNVTLPYKTQVIKFLNETDEAAKKIGAVNTLKFTDEGIKGYNTDVSGVCRTFSSRGLNIKDRNCLLLGAGGASDAICYALLKNEAKRIYIANRTVEKAEELKARLESSFNTEITVLPLAEAEKIKNVSAVLNGTTLGFGSLAHLSPLSAEFFKNNEIEICFDAIYTPWKTKLLETAKKNGSLCINGFDMLIYQAAAADEIWFGHSFEKEFLNNIKNNLKEIFMKTKEG